MVLVELAVLDSKTRVWSRYDITTSCITSSINVSSGDLIFTAGHNWDHPDHHNALVSYAEEGVLLGVLFYDIIPILFPFTYGPGFAEVYETWLQDSLKRCNCAFAISESSAHDVAVYSKKHGFNTTKVRTLRLGDDLPNSDKAPAEAIVAKTQTPYILTVGTVEFRKNHNMLLNAWRYMVNDQDYTPPNLYIVGRPGWLENDITYQLAHDPRLTNRIEILTDLSDADLQHLYQNTLFTLYPSIYEGWGLPIAESLGFGKVCVASNTSSMVEIAPGLIRHAHPLIVTEWVAHIRELVDNPEILASEEARIAAEYQIGTWERAASQLAESLVIEYPELRISAV